MKEPIFVCHYESKLLQQLHGKTVIFRVSGLDKIAEASAAAGHYQIKLRCILAESDMPLSSIKCQDSWTNIPIALLVPELGKFRIFADQIGNFRKHNIRVYIPTNSSTSYTHIRMLSSLGVETAIIFDDQCLDWEKLGDLMTYALWGFARHATIEPFSFIIRNYKNTEKLDFSGIYFDDPHTFLHLDDEGNAALTHRDLKRGNTFPLSLCNPVSGAYEEQIRRHEYLLKEFFLKEDGCAYCPGWRICLGKFAHDSESDGGCRCFFSDLLDAAERYQKIDSNKVVRWQP